jgi:hypothetical protein
MNNSTETRAMSNQELLAQMEVLSSTTSPFGYSIVEPFAQSPADNLRDVAEAVQVDVVPRLEEAAARLGHTLLIDPVHALFVPQGRSSMCHAWKIVSHTGVTFSLELITYRGDDTIYVSINRSTHFQIASKQSHAADILAAEICLALDVVLPRAA